MSPRQQRAPSIGSPPPWAQPQPRCSRLQPAWPMLPTILPTRSRVTASSTSAASPPSSMASTYMAGQMYVDVRIPAKQTHPYPDHHGARRHPFRHQLYWHARRPRRLGAVFRAPRLRGLCRRSARPRTLRLSAEVYGPLALRPTATARSAATSQQAKYKLWPQAHLHTQWPGTGELDDAVTLQMTSELPAGDRGFHQAAIPQPRCAGGADRPDRPVNPAWCIRRPAPSAGRWRMRGPTRSRRILAVEPNGPPFYAGRFHRRAGLVQGGTGGAALRSDALPLTYSPAVKDATELESCSRTGRRARSGDMPDAGGSRRASSPI